MSPEFSRLWAAAALPLGVLLILVAVTAILWADLAAAERAALGAIFTRPRLGMIGVLLAPALTLLGIAQYRVRSAQRTAVQNLGQSLRLIARGNPAYRLAPEQFTQLREVAEAVNELAQQRAQLLGDVQTSIAQARQGVEEEKNRFAALIAELDQSVLVCNRDGRILLFNDAVRALLAPSNAVADHQPLGLGRSVFGIVDRSLILHAFEIIEGQSDRGERESVRFVTAAADGRSLRVHVAPVFAAPGAAPAGAQRPARVVSGFVLLLADISADVDSDARSVSLFQDLVEGTRSAIAGIRAASETLIAQPELPGEERVRLAASVQGEARRLSERLDVLSVDVLKRLRQRWPLAQMRGADLLALAQRRIARRAGPSTRLERVDTQLWLLADSFTLVQALSSLAARLQEEFSVREVRFRLQATDAQAQLDVLWQGVPMSSETAYLWCNDSFTLGGEDSPLSLVQVMERHGGQAWYQRDVPTQTNAFHLLLPLAAEHTGAQARAPIATRPEFYDFNLFDRTPDGDSLDGRKLTELSYTVFDTETTGLDPVRGDEIISIGASRIVNGRLLQGETFESLVDPRRAVSAESIAVHGITADLLAGQPTIDVVLPRFARFAEDPVLVGHNAAFDMRFLQLKEERTGVKFRQPVLDTLLLAAVVHPDAPSQALEDVAQRMGIAVIGRHTALGDALATAEVFLRLIPLLAAQGIHTLGQARAASEKTYYARLQY